MPKPGSFRNPRGIALDSTGRMFVADWGNHRVQVFDNQGLFQKELGGLGSQVGQFNSPICVFVNRRIELSYLG